MTTTPHRLILLAAALIGSLHATPPVMDGEKILHLAATGVADIEQNQPMAADSVFWIASMIQRTDLANGNASDMRHDLQNATK